MVEIYGICGNDGCGLPLSLVRRDLTLSEPLAGVDEMHVYVKNNDGYSFPVVCAGCRKPFVMYDIVEIQSD